MNIIGVCGRGGSGKDTIANYLVNQYGYARVAAADAMKDDLCRYLDMDLETLEKIKNKKLKLVDWENRDHVDICGEQHGEFSIRRFLQLYGMDMRYRVSDTYWLESSIQMKADELSNNGQTKLVVSDVRFEIEYDWIKNSGGRVWYTDGRTVLGEEESKHVSEDFVNTTAKDKCDTIINNSGTIEELYHQIKVLMEWQESK
jgi:hypothetical protein